MSKKELYKQVMALPHADRQRMYDKLRASLSADLPQQLTPAEAKELLRRRDYYRKHPEKCLSLDEVKTALAKRRAERAR